jgi:RNA polymerase sigma-70 factor (ECF subfamily)
LGRNCKKALGDVTPEGVGKTTTDTLISEIQLPAGKQAVLDSVQTARYEAIVHGQSKRLIQMLDMIFLDRELAADAAQDAFVQLYLHWDEVGGAAEPEAWVYRVAVNRCKDYRRRMARAARLLRRLAATSAAPGNSAAVGPGWEPAQDFAAVLQNLPTRQRTAAALFYQADMSIAEISRTMGISEGAVNSHLNRARRTLKQMLEATR